MTLAKAETSSPGWTSFQFFHAGDEYFAAMTSLFREARTEILVETYIFEMDSLTDLLLTEMGLARKRGCRVRLLVDGFGSFPSLAALEERCRKEDIELRIFKNLPRSFASFLSALRSQRGRLFHLLRLWNRRNHRKFTLVDERQLLLGSFNWTKVHSESLMGTRAWRDSGVLLEGPGLADLRAAFESAWRLSRPKLWRRFLPRIERRPRPHPRASLLRIHEGRRLRRWFMRDLLGRFRRSERRVLIVSAYFLPTRSLIKGLIEAARRGVDVRVIVPGPSDVPAVRWAAAGLISRLIRSGVRVLEYQGRVLHAKYLLIDEWATLGSLNLNHRSFFHDFEIEAVFKEPDAVADLERQWFRDARECKPLSDPLGPGVPLWKRWAQRLAFRLRYFM